MKGSEYQKAAATTMVSPNGRVLAGEDREIVAGALRLMWTCGQIAELVKKGVLHGHGLDRGELRDWCKQALLDVADVLEPRPNAHGPLMGQQYMLTWNALGLAGEVAELIGETQDRAGGEGASPAAVSKEAGDVLWYLAGLLGAMGIDMDQVMAANIAKLQARYPDGFSKDASVARVDVSGAGPMVESGAAKGAGA